VRFFFSPLAAAVFFPASCKNLNVRNLSQRSSAFGSGKKKKKRISKPKKSEKCFILKDHTS